MRSTGLGQEHGCDAEENARVVSRSVVGGISGWREVWRGSEIVRKRRVAT